MGQHILKDHSVLQSIIETADLNEDDRVLEIGAGKGALTAVAAPGVKHLTALEVDERLCALLKERLKDFPNLDIVRADALTFDYEALPAPFKVIGNLPYYIATPLLMRLIENRENITGMTLMFQEEVARRLCASPGNKDYGALTIRVQYYAEVEKILTVPPRAFRPPPKVDSALVKVTFLKSPRVAPRDQRLFFKVVKASFAHRRKTIRNSLSAALHPSVDRQIIDQALKEAGIQPDCRGETLGMEDFLSLSDRISDMENQGLNKT
jgi:16S rRNA (adenine1518-N6/adenine1519-N6)-dimethyltransferase